MAAINSDPWESSTSIYHVLKGIMVLLDAALAHIGLSLFFLRYPNSDMAHMASSYKIMGFVQFSTDIISSPAASLRRLNAPPFRAIWLYPNKTINPHSWSYIDKRQKRPRAPDAKHSWEIFPKSCFFYCSIRDPSRLMEVLGLLSLPQLYLRTYGRLRMQDVGSVPCLGRRAFLTILFSM